MVDAAEPGVAHLGNPAAVSKSVQHEQKIQAGAEVKLPSRQDQSQAKDLTEEAAVAGGVVTTAAEKGLQAVGPNEATKALQALAAGLETVVVDRRVNLTFGGINTEDLIASDEPRMKALGYDLEIALLQREIANPNPEVVKRLETEGKIAAYKRKLFSEVVELRRQRGKITQDKEGRPIPPGSSVGALAYHFAETDQEKGQSAENPLGLLEAKLNETKADKKGQGKRVAFFDKMTALGKNLPEEAKAIFPEIISLFGERMDGALSAESAQRAQLLKSRALNVGGLIALLAILEAWFGATGGGKER